jgi:hypothetical protein
MEFIVARFGGARFKEQFKHIVVPCFTIPLIDIGEQVLVFKVGKKIQMLSVPQESGVSRGSRWLGLVPLPRKVEMIDWPSIFPGGFVRAAIDDRGRIRPVTFEGSRGRLLATGVVTPGESFAENVNKCTSEGYFGDGRDSAASRSVLSFID